MLTVVAAALVNDEGHVLVQQRPPGGSMPGLWEFPGGKIERGETLKEALVRELREELGVTVESSELVPLTFVNEPLGDRQLLLLLYLCRRWQGDVEPRHASALQWLAPTTLHALAMPPADRPLIAVLEHYL